MHKHKTTPPLKKKTTTKTIYQQDRSTLEKGLVIRKKWKFHLNTGKLIKKKGNFSTFLD